LEGILHLIELHFQPGDSFISDNAAQKICSLRSEGWPGIYGNKQEN